MWLSDSVIVYWDGVGGLIRVPIHASRDQPVGEARLWFSDPLYLETAGPSLTVTPDGGLMYVQGLGELASGYVRVVPNWVAQMKRAVDEANR